MLVGKVLVGKGKRGKEEFLYISDKEGIPRRFASMTELRRAAFMQFGDDLNVVVEEESHGTQRTTRSNRQNESRREEEAAYGSSLPS